MDIWSIITPTIFGGVAGATTNYLIEHKKIKSSKEQFAKQQGWEKEKIEAEERRLKNEKKFRAYNRVLEIDGKVIIFRPYPYTSFNCKDYEDSIRPILFENYNLLEIEVRESIDRIDYVLTRCGVLEEMEAIDEEELGDLYQGLIKNIKKQYQFV